MDRQELRATQAPIKERYREAPETALAISGEIPVSGTVTAEGDLDFRGTLGVASADDAAVGFSEIRLAFDLRTDAAPDRLDTLVRSTERYCIVYQTMAGGVDVSVSLAGSP